MPKSLAQLQARIAKLQQEAEALRLKQLTAVIEKIQATMSEHGLTVADLERAASASAAGKPVRARKLAAKRAKPAKSAAAAAEAAPKVRKSRKAKAVAAAPRAGRKAASAKTGGRPKGVIRFRDDQGNSWTGVGTRPKWFLAALAAGKTAEQLTVSPEAAAG